MPTIYAAANCIKTLEEKKFIFCQYVFTAWMPEVEILYSVMQSTSLSVKKTEDDIWIFQVQLQDLVIH